jgi:hypothetical protein
MKRPSAVMGLKKRRGRMVDSGMSVGMEAVARLQPDIRKFWADL